ncbi:hypothetical protein NEAUS04_1192 [Nematocida ausubeli]|nr:hypothetical protein NEAUS04_1192 [Nematocida ausubeli]
MARINSFNATLRTKSLNFNAKSHLQRYNKKASPARPDSFTGCHPASSAPTASHNTEIDMYLDDNKKHRETGICMHKKPMTSQNTQGFFIRPYAYVFLMLAILGMRLVCAILELEEAYEVQKTVVHEDNGIQWVASMNGPLSPLMLCIYDKTDFIYKQRLIYSNVDTYFIVSDKKNDNCFTRYPSKDMPYTKDQNENRMKKETIDLFTVLINLFPSPKKKTSIFSEETCKDSFTLFLKSDPVKDHAHMILASLLLLSEGIQVPLLLENVEDSQGSNKKLVLRKVGWEQRREEKEEHFSLNMSVAFQQEQEKSSTKCNLYLEKQTKAIQVIQFFISKRSNSILESIITSIDPDKKMELWTDGFIYSANYLIRSYIYYYLESTKEAISFNQTVYRMLKEHIEEGKKKNCDVEEEIGNIIFKKCFVPHDKISNTLHYWDKIQKIESIIANSKPTQILPFTDLEELSVKKTANINIWNNMYLTTEVFVTDIEHIVLGLFCCFAYDMHSNVYRTGHIPHILKDVEQVFSLPLNITEYIFNRERGIKASTANREILKKDSDHIAPGKKISKKIYQEWTKVVRKLLINKDGDSNLDNKSIKVGVFNMLTIIARLTRTYTTEKKRIDYFRSKMIVRGPSFFSQYSSEYKKELEEYIADYFASLSRDCVPCSGLADWYDYKHVLKRKRHIFVKFIFLGLNSPNYANDICGKLEIYYAYGREARPIIINLINKKTAYLDIGLPVIKLNKDKEENTRLMYQISKIPKDTFVDYVLSTYINRKKSRILDKYIILDYYIHQSLDGTTTMLTSATIQPDQYLSEYRYGIFNHLENNICQYADSEVLNYSNIRFLCNMLIDKQTLNIEDQLFLIGCLACVKSKTKNVLARMNDIRNDRRMYRDDISTSRMTEILSNIIETGSFLEIANVVTAYGQTRWSRKNQCINVLMHGLTPFNRYKVILALYEYSSLTFKSPRAN